MSRRLSKRVVLLAVLVAAVVAPTGARALPSFPHIDGVTPQEVVQGSDDVALLIEGSGFAPTFPPSPVGGATRVYADAAWSSASGWLESTVLSDTEIAAVLPARFMEEEGYVWLAAYNGAGPADLWVPTFWSNEFVLDVVPPEPDPGDLELTIDVDLEQLANDCFWLALSLYDEFDEPQTANFTFELSSDDLETDEPDDGPLRFYDDWGCEGSNQVSTVTMGADSSYVSLFARAPDPRSFTITASNHQLGLSITSEPILVRGGWLSGRVTDDDGTPVEGVQVYLASEGAGGPGDGFALFAPPIFFPRSGGGSCSYYAEGKYMPTVYSEAQTPYLMGPVAVTGPDGRYLSETVPPGFRTILFTAPGASGRASVWFGDVTDPIATAPIEVRDRETIEGIDARTPAGGAISIRVSDEAGASIDNVWVSVIDDATGRGLMGFNAGDGEGFLLPGLAAGSYRLHFDPWGTEHMTAWYARARHERDASPITVTAGSVSDVDMTLVRGATLTGIVGAPDSQEPVDAEVRVFDASSGTLVAEGHTWSYGPDHVESFETSPGLPAGNYKVQVHPFDAGHVDTWNEGSSFADAATVVLSEGQQREMSPVVDTGARFTGSVARMTPLLLGLGLPEGSAPFTGVLVYDADTGQLASTGCSDSKGVFTTSAVDAGRYKVRFVPSGDYAAHWHGGPDEEHATVFEVARGDTKAVEGVVEPGAVISGSVARVGPAAEGEMYVELFEADSARRLKAQGSEDGAFEFRGLPAGSFHLRAQDWGTWSEEVPLHPTTWYPGAPTRSTAAEVVVEGTQEIDASFSFGARSFISGTVTGLTRFGRHPTVQFIDPLDGTVVDSTWTARDGTYRSEQLHAGSYLVRMIGTWDRAPEYFGESATRAGAVTVPVLPGEETSGIDIEADPGKRVTGVARADFSGDRVGGVAVSVVDAWTGESVRGSRTDLDGVYATYALAPGAYKLVFIPDLVFAEQWFDRRTSFDTATVVELDGDDLAGIDALLTFS